MAFEREERYIVLKITDVLTHLNQSEIDQLRHMQRTVEGGRALAGKPVLRCVVVEKDWPEYDPTWAAIEARVSAGK